MFVLARMTQQNLTQTITKYRGARSQASRTRVEADEQTEGNLGESFESSDPSGELLKHFLCWAHKKKSCRVIEVGC